ncbi:MAG: GspE/PulE family protein [Deltaproteobacteria bacterium]|nr:GspE/PulE family protein [Deltaproteobacteria bacterium]
MGQQVQSNTKLLGEILIKEGLVTQNQLQEAAKFQSSAQEYKPIGQVLVEMKAITHNQLDLVLERFDKRTNLGDILLRTGIITQKDINIAVTHQNETGVRLGEALLKLNLISDKNLRQALCTQLNIPFVNLDNMDLDRNLARLINKKYARNRRIVPISKIGPTLTLAMDDPTDRDVVNELSAFTGLSINVVTSTRSAIGRAFLRLYEDGQDKNETSRVFRVLDEAPPDDEMAHTLGSEQIKRADDLVSQVIGLGIKHSASDIHLETTDQGMYVRYRIDGVLQDLRLGHIEGELRRLKREVISRIKIMGNLDITEKRRPQDGSFRAVLGVNGNGAKADFRISIVPGYYGENIVLRILDARNAPKSIDALGLSPRINGSLKELLKRNSGILLVTGPTGSGKSTTLYGSLMSAYRPGIKILTAEDPIEYLYDKITQCQVNPAIGNTFANFIRAFLRQDPEIILVGEIRDSETADMSFRAAQTGHLVLSTLHTNDAVGTIPRLLGLGVDPGLIGSCLIGVLSQRLVREVCPKCKTETNPPEEFMKEFFVTPPSGIRWVAGQKCFYCNHTGYKGRLAVAELWIPNEKDLFLVHDRTDIDVLRKSLHRSKDSVLMAEDAIQKLREEKTTLEELLRALPFSSIYDFRKFQDHSSNI